MIKKNVTNSLRFLLATFVVTSTFVLLMEFSRAANQIREVFLPSLYDFDKIFRLLEKLTVPKIRYGNGNFNQKFLTHQLIDIDSKLGISSLENKNKALRNVNFILDKINQECAISDSDDGKLNYVQCANALVIQYFPYEISASATSYAFQRADCDLYTYVMMDALLMKGIDSRIVYAPGHAFLAFMNKGKTIFWETTSNDLVNFYSRNHQDGTSFYRLSLSNNDYHLFDKAVAKDIYNLIILGSLVNLRINPRHIDIKHELKKLLENYPNFSIVKNVYYHYLFKNNSKLSPEDIGIIQSELNIDFHSLGSKELLMSYYINNNNLKEAERILYSIPINVINSSEDYRELAKKIDRFYLVRCDFLLAIYVIMYILTILQAIVILSFLYSESFREKVNKIIKNCY